MRATPLGGPIRSSATPVVLLAVAFALAGCDRSPAAVTDLDPGTLEARSGNGSPLAAHGDLLKAVRQATSRFNSTVQAQRAGYAADDHCVAVPGLGGMGYHWVNQDLVDPVFEPLAPEALLYAPGRGGNLRLVGVEYIVIDVGQSHPTFDGYPFDVGGVPPLMDADVPHFSLHVWVHQDNPAGMFEPFNPDIRCG